MQIVALIFLVSAGVKIGANSNFFPCGPIESLFLLSPARILEGTARLYSSELSYSGIANSILNRIFWYFSCIIAMVHRNFPSVEFSGGRVDGNPEVGRYGTV